MERGKISVYLDSYMSQTLDEILIFGSEIFRHLSLGDRCEFAQETICNADEPVISLKDAHNRSG